jgi:hypothetical protein
MSVKRQAILFCAVMCFGAVAKAGFLEVTTSFGPNTGLADLSTGLTWLDLSITNDQSFDSVLLNTASGGIYAGWQFATPAQLSAMFLDYTGGITFFTDAGAPPSYSALALAFMNALGGPLTTINNPANGFSRMSSAGFLNVPFDLGTASYGYIAVDNFFGPSIDPGLNGSSVENLGVPGIGSWLVQSTPTPEPSSLSLLVFGGAAIFLARIRSRRRT